MAVVLDIIPLAIALVCILSGYKNGFIRTAYKLFRTVASFIVALVFAEPFSKVVAENPLFKSFMDGIYKKFDGMDFKIPETTTVSLEDSLSPAAKDFLAKLDISFSELGDYITSLINSGEQNIIEGVREYVLDPITSSLAFALAFIILFFVSGIAFKIISIIMDGTVKVVGLGGINRFFGLLLGGVGGFVYAVAFCTVVTIIMPYLVTADIGITESVVAETRVFREIAAIGMGWLFSA